MAQTRAADDFTAIKKEMDRIKGTKSTPVVSPSSSPAKPQAVRAADDFDEIRKHYRKPDYSKPASLDASPVWPGPTQCTRMGGSAVAKRGVTFG